MKIKLVRNGLGQWSWEYWGDAERWSPICSYKNFWTKWGAIRSAIRYARHEERDALKRKKIHQEEVEV